MDFDKISNCSGMSSQSDEVRSNVSTLSGLSTYQDEFTELCHLVNPKKYPTAIFEKCFNTTQDLRGELISEDCFRSLTCQLQDALKQNEKFKYDLYNAEKNIELKYNEKIEKLLRNNNKLKCELDNANGQIERLIRNFSSKRDTTSVLHKNFIQLEQKYHNLTVQNSALQYESLEIKSEKEECERENKELRIELKELKIDIDARNACVNSLKEKVSQQHIENQSLLKNNLLASQSLNEVTSELEHAQKIQDWYKEQLHSCQSDKKILSDEILKLKTDFSLQHDNIEVLNVEIAKWKNKCDIVKLEGLKEKEKLCKQLEDINCVKNVTICKSCQSQSDFVANNDYKNIVNYYESSIQDLTNEVLKVKEFVQEQDKNIKRLTKENAELTGTCIMLQKTVYQNEINTEQLEHDRKHLSIELDSIKNIVKEQSDQLNSSKKQIVNLEAESNIRMEEKELVENTVKTIREQFSNFKYKYEALKEDLLNKNKQILLLQTEKQKLFMNNNWNICELGKMKEKDEVIHKLKDTISSREQEINKNIVKIKRLENELNEKEDVSKNLLSEKQSVIEKHSLEVHRYEDVFTQYKIMVTDYERQVNVLRNVINERNKIITDLEDNIKILKEEINRRDSDLCSMSNKCTTLENNITLISEEKETSSKFNNNGNSEESLKTLSNENSSILGRVLLRFIKTHHIDTSITNTDTKTIEPMHVNEILKNIDTYLQDNLINKTVEDEQDINNQLKKNIHRLKNIVGPKITKMEERIKTLYKSIEESNRILSSISNCNGYEENEKLQELNVLLQVKDLELKEKQKKYETNNRTLLRKVKEHMKGRNAAEKHNKYLQDLYNSLSDENNSLKLAVSSKEHEIGSMKKLLENHININEKLKQSILQLEEKAYKNLTCDKCIEYATAMNKIQVLEQDIRELEDGKITTQNILMIKEDIISNLQKEKQKVMEQNLSLKNDKNKYENKIKGILSDKQNLTNKINGLEKELKNKQLVIDELNVFLKEENNKYLECNGENIQLKKDLDQMNSRMEYLSNEIEILQSTLQSRSEELDHLTDKNSELESLWKKKDQQSQKVIVALKNHLHDIQVDITSINSEKHFLQRLCNDLKLALKTHVNHNKMLKEQINNLSKEKQDCISLPNILPDIPNPIKYDDDYINKLLQQNRSPLQDQPLTEIRGCLDTLRRQISTLQEEIAKKNIHIS